MIRIIFCLFSLFAGIGAWSQKTYFVYIQSENSKPFYVRTGDQYRSSSPAGYINLSQLGDSTIRFGIGFPGNSIPEQQFAVAIRSTDHGFLLKNFAEKGWGLFDLQTMEVAMNYNAAVNANTKPEKEVSSFTHLLSKASGDTSILYETRVAVVKPADSMASPTIVKVDAPVAKAGEKKDEKNNPVNENTITSAEKTSLPIQPEKISDPIKQETIQVIKDDVQIKNENQSYYQKSTVIRKSESSTTEGFGLVFIDRFANGKEDTIRLLISNEPVRYNIAATSEPETETKPVQTNALAEEVKTINTTSELNKNCKSLATDSDLETLEKSIGAKTKDDEKIEEANKLFNVKCFTTAQVRELSRSFQSDYTRYLFFQAAYPHTIDIGQFPMLESEIKDAYFKKRFKSILDTK